MKSLLKHPLDSLGKGVLVSILGWAVMLGLGVLGLVSQDTALANRSEIMGVHILTTYELKEARELLATDQDEWHFVTIPYTLSDIEDTKRWQEFFDEAKKLRLIPLVRLTTKFENGAWQPPTRKDIVTAISTLARLNWPTDQKHIIIYNEVNHAPEWGGKIDPADYAAKLRFAGDWARAENANFVVLPAAMDLAAPNGPRTMEAFTYLRAMLAADPTVFEVIDIWNSHSYPNPAFSAPANRRGQNSLRGFEYELEFIARETGRELSVMITETGWEENGRTRGRLENYYQYAYREIWSDERILAVTPFLLRGAPGPFAGFSLLSDAGEPTEQYRALRRVMER